MIVPHHSLRWLPLLLLGACASPTPQPPPDTPVGAPPTIAWDTRASPLRLTAQVVASYPHDPAAWTQGLLWYDGAVLESTGLRGRSELRRVELTSGAVRDRIPLEAALFGEGLALDRVRGRLVQLTWEAGRALIWDVARFTPAGSFRYEGTGWGLCHDGRRFIMSQGTRRLSFRDPESFAEVGHSVLQVDAPLQLNELECAEGRVYANVWHDDRIVVMDPDSGRLLAWIDASGLLTASEEAQANILNGIAHVPERGTFLLTGKLWPRVVEVRLVAR